MSYDQGLRDWSAVTRGLEALAREGQQQQNHVLDRRRNSVDIVPPAEGRRDIIWLGLKSSHQAARCPTTLGEQEWAEVALIDREQVQDREHPEV